MRGPGEKLTHKQEVAIAVPLTAQTIADAAHTASISESSLWGWLQREDFQTAYRKAGREAVSQAMAYLQRAAGEAVDILRAVMRDAQKLMPASAPPMPSWTSPFVVLNSRVWRRRFKHANNGSQTEWRHDP
jgi:hypothetical protein